MPFGSRRYECDMARNKTPEQGGSSAIAIARICTKPTIMAYSVRLIISQRCSALVVADSNQRAVGVPGLAASKILI